jgi:serine/threonine protein kinase/Tol biopolymer transport system component
VDRIQLPNLARFGVFELDLRARELRKAGLSTGLPEQSIKILALLLEKPGDVVLREEIRKKLWPNDTVVEFDHSINAAIKRLRQALGDPAEAPQYIETLARRGYRWKIPVEWVNAERGAEQAAAQGADLSRAVAGGSLIGRKVTHYRVLEVLGGGGMGVVYKAEDIKLGRRVALKFLPEELADDPAAMQRFEREARAASALNHPNICTIHAVEENEGQPFIAMELLEGHTLRDVLAQEADSKSDSRFQLEPLLDTALQIAHGLEAAHQKGIIHRDIKPANIFITSQGQAKILDFGLAKLHDSESMEPQPQPSAEPLPQQESNPLLTLTRTGVTIGTAAYMSPEQVRGERLDRRTDLFSFGLVLHEMATRQRAFPGDTAPVLHDAILNRTPVPARELNSQIPPKLESIITRAVEKDRAARYQTAAEICADLEALQRQSTPKRLPWAWVAGLGVAAAIAVGTVFFMLKRPPKTVSVAPEIKMRQLTVNSTENPVVNGTISPDGKYLMYIDTRGLHLKFIDTGETRIVPGPEALKDQSVKWEDGSWFPDSTRFVVNLHPRTEEWTEFDSARNSIWVVSVLGGAPTKLRDHAVAWSVSPDGSLVSFGTNKGKLGERELWLMGPDGEQARKFQETDETHALCCLIWSADRKQYLYISTNSSGDTVLSRNANGGPPVNLFQPSELAKIHDLVWLHDGRLVYSLAEPWNTVSEVCNYWTMRIDLATGRHLEEPRRLTNWPNFCASSGSVSNNDKRLAFVAWSGFYTTYVADLEAGGKRLRNIRHFTLEDSDDQALGWTPDGRLIVAQNRGSSWRVYKQSLDSDTQEPIASSAAGDWLLQGATSADGKWYISNVWPVGQSLEHPSIPFPILRIPLAGGAPETIMQLSRQPSVSCARPPSNTCVIAERSEDRKELIVSVLDPIKGRGPVLARFDSVFESPLCILSPDGTRLAMVRSPESPIEIRSLHGQLLHKIPSQSVGELTRLTWSADQEGLFVNRKAPNGIELLHLDFEGNVTSLRKCVDAQACSSYPSPDGRHLAIIDRNQNFNMWMMENF